MTEPQTTEAIESPSMKIEMVPIEELKPASYNPRMMSPDKMEMLKDNIGDPEIGFAENIVVNKRTGTIISGHQRVAAAGALGMKNVPVYYVDVSEDKEKQLNIWFNKGTGEFDMLKLPDLMAGLPKEMQELTGFSQDEVNSFLGKITDGVSEKNAELNIDSIEGDLRHECPRCHFQY